MIFDMVPKNSYKEFYDQLNDLERLELEKLTQKYGDIFEFEYNISNESGIGKTYTVKVKTEEKTFEYNITDYSRW